jgi:hypothetical protein
MAKIRWNISVQMDNAPVIAASTATEPVEANDKLVVDIPNTANDEVVVVNVQPGSAEDITLFVVKSSRYDPNIRFSAGDSLSNNVVRLDAPQIFSGGSIGLLGAAPQQFAFSNQSEQPVTVEIFVARRATQTDQQPD